MRLSSPVSGYSPNYNAAPKAAPQFTGRKKEDKLDPLTRAFLAGLAEEKAAEKAEKRANSTTHLLGQAAKKLIFTMIGKEYTPPQRPAQTEIEIDLIEDRS